MFNKRMKIVVAASFILTQSISPASASWMNDWIGAKSTKGAAPSYMEGQARGYLSGGSYSARWPVSQNNHLLSVAPPKLSAGCGGIDFFGGSLSFLKTDMLVQKLQNVMSNAAGVAFQMALDTLSPKIAAIVTNMEDLSNKLNSMSMDDCAAAKGVVTGVRSFAESVSEGYKMGELGTGITEGLSDSYTDIKRAVPAVATLADVNSWTTSQKGGTPGHVEAFKGCPADIKELFPSDNTKYPVSVLSLVGAKMALPATHLNLLRGLTGDIIINNVVTDGAPVSYKQPCSPNSNFTIAEIISGDIETMNKDGVCTGLPASETNLKDHVGDKIQVIMSRLVTKTALGPTEVAFISSMSTPLLYGLRVAVMTGQQSSLTPMLVDTAAAGISMQAMKDLLTRYEEILVYMDQTKKFSDSKSDCRLSGIALGLDTNVELARANINKTYQVMGQSYQQALQEFTTSFALNNQLVSLNAQLKNNIARSFGASVAQRAMRSL